MLRALAGVLLLPCLVLQAHAAEDEAPRDYAAMAVQNRLYLYTHEFTLFAGVLPIDAFTKGITASFAYTLHFTDAIGWEVVNFTYAMHANTSLRKDLLAYDLKPTPFEVVDSSLTSNFVFKPVYWKGAWLNGALIHGEFFLVAGGGYSWLTASRRPTADFGAGARLFVSKHFSVRLDARPTFFIVTDGWGVKEELWIALGTSFSF
jgi:outer membrane beta-barrel protein